jgi:hypothetical protein
MGRVVDIIFYSEMIVIFYLFVIDPVVHIIQRHDGLLPMLSATAHRLQLRSLSHRCLCRR